MPAVFFLLLNNNVFILLVHENKPELHLVEPH